MHDAQTKSAVIAALLTGQGVTEVAKTYKLAKSVVSRWKSDLPDEQIEAIATAAKDRVGDLIYSNLQASFEAVNNILEQTRDEKWLIRQSASELGVFYGIICDKQFRILEAIENAQGGRDDL